MSTSMAENDQTTRHVCLRLVFALRLSGKGLTGLMNYLCVACAIYKIFQITGIAQAEMAGIKDMTPPSTG